MRSGHVGKWRFCLRGERFFSGFKLPLTLRWGFVIAALFLIQLTACSPVKNANPGATEAGSNPSVDYEEPNASKEEFLDGLLLVSIGNNPSARPQSGLSEAAIVFEVPAEGGITRLMAGFTKKVDKIGPVRSARKPLVQIAAGYGAPYAHCGGSTDSFEIIRTQKIHSLDEIYTAGECFWRSSDRSAPDNLYTSTDKLVDGASRRGYDLSLPVFSQKGTLLGDPSLYVAYDFSNNPKYPDLVEYFYEESGYRRYINGEEHVGDKDEVIAPKALVFLQVRTTYPVGKLIEVDMDVTGEGEALFFSNGVMREGTWEKPSLKEPLMLYINGREPILDEGLIWVHLVPDLRKVNVKDTLGE
ncbi:MAG TPA: DUF3048 domain-containing protein [Bacillota bacterium]|nr:DUF3048 domain-containing protein [Bacillota bacterium]HOL11841.1 DUF3048 domain-containing protein [Bacillota bacterium]HPP60738.1 DUF3048 domain-containing protein [Bacillota bacterium]